MLPRALPAHCVETVVLRMRPPPPRRQLNNDEDLVVRLYR